ncbi:MAG: hypothetical protein ACTTGZ_06405, partial [Treponema sp.]
RSEKHAPPEARSTPRPKREARPARSALYIPSPFHGLENRDGVRITSGESLIGRMSSFEKLRCAFGYVSSAALTTEFAMQTRQSQSSALLETARSRNYACAQTMLISKLFILLEPERVGKF